MLDKIKTIDTIQDLRIALEDKGIKDATCSRDNPHFPYLYFWSDFIRGNICIFQDDTFWVLSADMATHETDNIDHLVSICSALATPLTFPETVSNPNNEEFLE